MNIFDEEKEFAQDASRATASWLVRYAVALAVGCGIVFGAGAFYSSFYSANGGANASAYSLALFAYGFCSYRLFMDPRALVTGVSIFQIGWRLLLAAVLSPLFGFAVGAALGATPLVPLIGGLAYGFLGEIFICVPRRRRRHTHLSGQDETDFDTLNQKQSGSPRASSKSANPSNSTPNVGSSDIENESPLGIPFTQRLKTFFISSPIVAFVVTFLIFRNFDLSEKNYKHDDFIAVWGMVAIYYSLRWGMRFVFKQNYPLISPVSIIHSDSILLSAIIMGSIGYLVKPSHEIYKFNNLGPSTFFIYYVCSFLMFAFVQHLMKSPKTSPDPKQAVANQKVIPDVPKSRNVPESKTPSPSGTKPRVEQTSTPTEPAQAPAPKIRSIFADD